MAQTSTKKKKNSSGQKQTSTKAKKPSNTSSEDSSVQRIIAAVCFLFAAVLVAIGIFAHDGVVVGWLCALLKGLFGYGFWICAPVFLLAAYILGFRRDEPCAWRLTAALLLPLLAGSLVNLLLSQVVVDNLSGVGELFSVLYAGGKSMLCAGVLGTLIAFALEKAFSIYGAAILLLLALIFFILAALSVTPKKLIAFFSAGSSEKSEKKPAKAAAIAEPETESAETAEQVKKTRRHAIDIPLDDEPAFTKKTPASEEPTVKDEPAPKKAGGLFGKKAEKSKPLAPDNIEVEPLTIEEVEAMTGISAVRLSGDGEVKTGAVSDPPKKATAAEVAAETEAIRTAIESATSEGEYEKPPIFLLKKGHTVADNSADELRTNRERLESTIKSFGVSARIVDTTRGPTVTRYDIELDQGVKLSRLTNLAGDIALALGVVSVRIAPIPDKISTVGIEVPNKIISTVYLRDIIDSPRFASSKSKLSFAIGKDIAGQAVVGNISKLPHLLIAGTTGSGKSVCMNSLIISLLYKADPDEVKLIMIDPKMVELGVYNGIPHLYIPVVTDPKKAAGALQWAVTEMLKRYRLFSELGVRSLEAYNEHLLENDQPKMPSIVVVIDELADLMLVASKDVEESICRVAQMGRAAGMHLVIATQRPSADVITGLMKANIPSRIAFAVSSALESRIILDNAGAEKLIGMGDMLYAPIGCGKPLRVQGAFVSDEERDQIVQFIKRQSTAQYSEDVMAQIEKAAEDKGANGKGRNDDDEPAGKPEYDELLPQAVDVIFDTKQASVSMLQRRLKLGYSRAARIVDQMEEMGIIGPFEGSKPRQILITRDQWLEMQTTQGTAPTEILQIQTEFNDETDDI